MSPQYALLISLLITLTSAFNSQARFTGITGNSEYAALNSSVGGRLFKGTPIVQPCVPSKDARPGNCTEVLSEYVDEGKDSPFLPLSSDTTPKQNAVFRTSTPGGYVVPQWETCQTTGAQCLLDYTDPFNLDPVTPPRQCRLGSIPSHFVRRLSSFLIRPLTSL